MDWARKLMGKCFNILSNNRIAVVMSALPPDAEKTQGHENLGLSRGRPGWWTPGGGGEGESVDARIDFETTAAKMRAVGLSQAKKPLYSRACAVHPGWRYQFERL